MSDVIANPSASGLAWRNLQLERDRLALIAQLEREQLVPVSPPPEDRLQRNVMRSSPREP